MQSGEGGVVDSAPPGLHPAEAGVLLRTRVATRYLVATIIDLTVRGCLSVQHEEDGSWTLRRTGSTPSQLETYERTMLKKLFPTVQGRRRRTTSTLQITSTKGGFGTVRQGIERRVDDLGFFRVPPSKGRHQMRLAGSIVGATGAVLIWPLSMVAGAGMLGVALVLAGLVIAASGPLMAARTPQGTEVRRQLEAFQEFLSADDPGLIDWQHHPRAFSEYLPWTVIFGSQDQWVTLFQQLVDEGRLRPKTLWYLPSKETFWHREGPLAALSELVNELSTSILLADRHEEAIPDDGPLRW